ncbi:Uu.00g119150.m01.CDS01 [Anthostomella pinea]|uniref:Uu.00g119150.m01.CDS01 n=1 Tax=Anthostomella pinea TaxID=933095 RepID=A0AAI8VH28_9PEZI|nr:Uu.00g119150.m01.CDS01 [Anthostomella pinea]
MRYHTTILLAAGAFAVHVAAIQVRSEVPEGYTIQPMTWRGVIEKDGPEMAFNGTIQQVEAQIQAMKPGFTWQALRRDLGMPQTSLQKRSKDKIYCDIGGDLSVPNGPLTVHVEWAHDALQANTGTCAVDGGPKVCSRVACSSNAGVWLCNDSTDRIEPKCHDLASYVQDIIGRCNKDSHGHKTTRGQEFDTGNFIVNTGWASDC